MLGNHYTVLNAAMTAALINENDNLVEAVKNDDTVIMVKLLQEPFKNVVVALYGMKDVETDDGHVNISIETQIVSIPQNKTIDDYNMTPNSAMYMLVNDVFTDIMQTAVDNAKRIVEEENL